MRTGSCLFDVLYDYLEGRKYFVRADNTSSKFPWTTTGVQQRSLLGPLLFCIFINELPHVLRFLESNLFAEYLNIIAFSNRQIDVQHDIDAIDSWVGINNMELTFANCSTLKFRGTEKVFHLATKPPKNDSEVEDLGKTVCENFHGQLT